MGHLVTLYEWGNRIMKKNWSEMAIYKAKTGVKHL